MEEILVACIIAVIILLWWCWNRPSEEEFRPWRRRWGGWGGWGGWGRPWGGYGGAWGYNPYLYAGAYNTTPTTVIVQDSNNDPSKLTKEEWEYLYTSADLKGSPIKKQK